MKDRGAPADPSGWRQVEALPNAANPTLDGEKTAPRDTGTILGWENSLRSSVAVKSSSWRGESRPFPALRRVNVAQEEGRKRWRGELAGAAGIEDMQ